MKDVKVDFEKYKEDKSSELDELNTLTCDENAKNTGKIDAADAQI